MQRCKAKLSAIIISQCLKNLLQDTTVLLKAYQRGRRDAIKETEIVNLPQDCPYYIEQTLDHNFLP